MLLWLCIPLNLGGYKHLFTGGKALITFDYLQQSHPLITGATISISFFINVNISLSSPRSKPWDLVVFMAQHPCSFIYYTQRLSILSNPCIVTSVTGCTYVLRFQHHVFTISLLNPSVLPWGLNNKYNSTLSPPILSCMLTNWMADSSTTPSLDNLYCCTS